METSIIFGPVPSRRLGQSLGINNIPPKICSYSCVYCQIGKTKNISIERSTFYSVERIVDEVSFVLKQLQDKGEKVDFLSFVPDGEPTLDINLGKEIEALKKFKIKIAVITNSSLLWRQDVRDDVKKADLVSLKIDTVDREIWKKINRPSEYLCFDKVLEGMKIFASEFDGTLITETLIVRGINDSEESAKSTGVFISELCPSVAYIGIPTRPPAELWVVAPEKEKILYTYEIFTSFGIKTELLIESKEGTFGFTGDIEKDILNIVSVHPMSESQIRQLLKKASSDWSIIAKLISEGKIEEIEYKGEKYYLKSFK